MRGTRRHRPPPPWHGHGRRARARPGQAGSHGRGTQHRAERQGRAAPVLRRRQVRHQRVWRQVRRAQADREGHRPEGSRDGPPYPGPPGPGSRGRAAGPDQPRPDPRHLGQAAGRRRAPERAVHPRGVDPVRDVLRRRTQGLPRHRHGLRARDQQHQGEHHGRPDLLRGAPGHRGHGGQGEVRGQQRRDRRGHAAAHRLEPALRRLQAADRRRQGGPRRGGPQGPPRDGRRQRHRGAGQRGQLADRAAARQLHVPAQGAGLDRGPRRGQVARAPDAPHRGRGQGVRAALEAVQGRVRRGAGRASPQGRFRPPPLRPAAPRPRQGRQGHPEAQPHGHPPQLPRRGLALPGRARVDRGPGAGHARGAHQLPGEDHPLGLRLADPPLGHPGRTGQGRRRAGVQGDARGSDPRGLPLRHRRDRRDPGQGRRPAGLREQAQVAPI